jgi:hypothetical protein
MDNYVLSKAFNAVLALKYRQFQQKYENKMNRSNADLLICISVVDNLKADKQSAFRIL